MQKTFGTGALLSPPDYRDGIMAAAIVRSIAPVALPDTFETDLSNIAILFQGFIPACVSHSMALVLKRWWYRKTGQLVDFSPRFLDILAKRFDGLGDPTNRATAGTYGRVVAKVLATYGCCTTTLLPNDTSLPILTYRDDTLITDAMLKEAEQYKIPGYVHVPDDFYSLRAMTKELELLSIAMFIGQNFGQQNPNFILSVPDVIESGHQMVLKGWDAPTQNRLRNSWGNAWEDQGEANYDALAWAPFTQEAWGISEIPTDVATFLHSLPAAADFHYQWSVDLHYLDFNEGVRFAQVAYMILGLLQPITPDEFGHFGPKTRAANLTYQLQNKITPVPSSIGPLTRAALNKQFQP